MANNLRFVASTGDKLSEEKILSVLSNGEITLASQFVWGSNYTYMTDVTMGKATVAAVYKPLRGERPLWDFPDGTLAAREVAAYLTSQALGWNFVPPTVLRDDGPIGPGSLQLYVQADPDVHYFSLSKQDKEERLKPVVVFDLLINNADRKGGHILSGARGQLWLIDHGVSFHHQNKLRTVVWDFAGQPIPKALLADLAAFRELLSSDVKLENSYRKLLSKAEFKALRARAERLLAERRFPEPGPGRPFPWPLV